MSDVQVIVSKLTGHMKEEKTHKARSNYCTFESNVNYFVCVYMHMNDFFCHNTLMWPFAE